MELINELEKLKTLFQNHNTNEFKKQLTLLKDNFTSETDAKQIDVFIDKMVKEEMAERDRSFNDIKLQTELILNKEIIPFSYIAKNYFKRSKSWLYQRLNGNNINGKPVKFTENEIETFNFAIQDISRKLGAISIR